MSVTFLLSSTAARAPVNESWLVSAISCNQFLPFHLLFLASGKLMIRGGGGTGMWPQGFLGILCEHRSNEERGVVPRIWYEELLGRREVALSAIWDYLASFLQGLPGPQCCVVLVPTSGPHADTVGTRSGDDSIPKEMLPWQPTYQLTQLTHFLSVINTH